MTKHVRAVDVGYGNTKYVVAHDGRLDVKCSLFPSIAPAASLSGDVSSGIMVRRNTVLVDVDGVTYEVGNDAVLAKDATYGRVLDEHYCKSSTHLALLRGALAYMQVEHLHMMVVGLPLITFQKYKGYLAEHFRGTHRVPAIRHRDRPIEYIDVQVDEVAVFPQPMGAWLDHAISTGVYKQMRNQMNLVVDPGFFTLDWLVSQGMKPIDSRSGAHAGGMSSILSAVAESAAATDALGGKKPDINIIDEAIRTSTNPRFFGQEFDLTPHLAAGKEKARQFVSVLANRVGDGMDIDNIILAGGGARFFQEHLQEKFPRHKIVVSANPVYANVRGFQLAGHQQMQNAWQSA